MAGKWRSLPQKNSETAPPLSLHTLAPGPERQRAWALSLPGFKTGEGKWAGGGGRRRRAHKEWRAKRQNQGAPPHQPSKKKRAFVKFTGRK